MVETMRKETEDNRVVFTCPECGGKQLLEYLVNSRSIRVLENGEVETRNTEMADWGDVQFFCRDCGRVIVDDFVQSFKYASLEAIAADSVQAENSQSISQYDTAGPDSGHLQFTCPECGGHMLDEVTVTFWIVDFDEKGLLQLRECYYATEEKHFMCGGCGWIVQDKDHDRVVTYDALLARLRTNQK
jgi:predicted RNA-binding Zn-ribbon protein involved in translation (DUF1610 family)